MFFDVEMYFYVEMYLKKGYEIDEFHNFMVGDGDYPCIHSMKKIR